MQMTVRRHGVQHVRVQRAQRFDFVLQLVDVRVCVLAFGLELADLILSRDGVNGYGNDGTNSSRVARCNSL